MSIVSLQVTTVGTTEENAEAEGAAVTLAVFEGLAPRVSEGVGV